MPGVGVSVQSAARRLSLELTPQEYARRYAYCRRAVRNVGIALDDEQDAIHDIMLRAEIAGQFSVTVVRWGAIDAARRYGKRARSGRYRETAEIPETYTLDPWPATEYILDHVAAVRSLTKAQKRNLLNHVAGVTSGNACQVKAYKARQRLRAAVG